MTALSLNILLRVSIVANKHLLTAIVLTILVLSSYVINFYFKLNYPISNDAAVWGQLGDYIGGLLNPALSFISLILLIKSLTLQTQSNEELRKQIKNSEKNEKIRFFEDKLFNMIDAQKTNFNSMKLKMKVNGKTVTRQREEAVIELEEEIARMRHSDKSDHEIHEYLKKIEVNDQIYNATRIFYITIKLISEKLENSDFSSEDRIAYILTLINFTDFALLRLIMMSIQFMDYSIIDYLKNNDDFNLSLNRIDINYNLY